MQLPATESEIATLENPRFWRRNRYTVKEKKDWKAGLWALLFLGPNLILFLVFTAYPVWYGLYISLYNYSILKPKKWVGLGNYEKFIHDPDTPDLIWRSIYYAVGTTIPVVFLPLFVAVLITRSGVFTKPFRLIYILPIVTSPVAAAAIWKWLYAKDFGLINYGLSLIGANSVDWLYSLRWSMPAVIVMSIWLLVPFNIILYTAGLQEVPRDLYDAAEVDGASSFQQFHTVTVPMITPTIFFVFLITMIGVLVGGFDVINVLTQGGPLQKTNILIYDIYKNAFENFKMGYASAQAYVLFLGVLLVTLFNWVLQKRWVHYA
ncbi:MAG TPA: sugar ABC transporter permease [Thermomicrobiales bacterium]|nr:sugar ABC transporter permease [Thermomicrobiales bacterium]